MGAHIDPKKKSKKSNHNNNRKIELNSAFGAITMKAERQGKYIERFYCSVQRNHSSGNLPEDLTTIFHHKQFRILNRSTREKSLQTFEKWKNQYKIIPMSLHLTANSQEMVHIGMKTAFSVIYACLSISCTNHWCRLFRINQIENWLWWKKWFDVMHMVT